MPSRHQVPRWHISKALLPERLVLDTACETVALFHQHWQAERVGLLLSADAIRTIEDHISTIPIA